MPIPQNELDILNLDRVQKEKAWLDANNTYQQALLGNQEETLKASIAKQAAS